MNNQGSIVPISATFSSRSQEIIILTNNQAQPSELVNTFRSSYPNVYIISSLHELNQHNFQRVIIFDQNTAEYADVAWVRRNFSKCFIVIYQPSACCNPEMRLMFFDSGANMVAHDFTSLFKTLNDNVMSAGMSGGTLTCPYCDFHSLTEEELWRHMPAYHINYPNEAKKVTCPICYNQTSAPLQVHIHEEHGPRLRKWIAGEPNYHSRVRLYSFSLVVCRHPVSGAFLLCQEFANQGFWLPGGAVDAGESLTKAARRETMEEAGVDVEIKGILGIEYTPQISQSSGDGYVRMRTIFYAEPVDVNQMPKSSPDFESAGACWCSYDQMTRGLRLRGKEPLIWAK